MITSSIRRFSTLLMAVAALLGAASRATAQNNLALSPSSLRFDSAVGGLSQTQFVNVTSSTAGLTYTAVVQPDGTINGTTWLSVPTGGSGTTGSANSSFTVQVTPTNLLAGIYTGRVRVTAVGAANSPQDLVVTLNVGQTAQLQVSPANLSFFYQPGTATPPAQVIAVSSSGTSLSFSATAATNTGGNWLSVAPISGTASATPTNLSVTVNPVGLPVGSYTGQITVFSGGASNPSQTIPVTLNVSLSPPVVASPAALTYNFAPNSTAFVTRQIVLSSGGTAYDYSVSLTPTSGGNWTDNRTGLDPGGTGRTPVTLNFTVNPTGLTAGTYTADLLVTANGAPNSPIRIPVTVNVTPNAFVQTSVDSVTFGYQIGTTAPANQTVDLTTNTGASVTFTAVSSSPFLTVTPGSGTTPGQLSLSLNPAGLTPGVYPASVTLTAGPAGSQTTTVLPVTVVVSTSPLLNVSRNSLNFAYQTFTPAPASQTLQITSTSTALPINVVTSANSPWLIVTPTAGTTPTALQVNVNPSIVSVGTYTASITISSPGVPNSPIIIPVTLSVSNTASLVVGPGPLQFQQSGGTAPATQSINVTSSGAPISFNVSTSSLSGGNFFTVSPATGVTPSTLTVAVSGNGLQAGTYTGSVIITPTSGTATNTPQVVPVTLVLSAGATLAASTTTVALNAPASSTAIQQATVQITAANATGAVPLTVTATSSTGSWLTAAADNPNAPATITIRANPTGLAPGTYTGTVAVTSPGAGNSPLNITVNFTVAAIPAGNIAALVNSATFQPGPISPGELVTIFGSNIGPTTGVGLRLNAQGNVDTTLGDVQVLFDGIPAPLAYVSALQINLVVPYEIAGRPTTQVTVRSQGVSSNTITFNVQNSVPGIFTVPNTAGQVSAQNQDGSVNSATAPAARGDVVVFYATGEGLTTPPGVTGRINPANSLPRPVLPVTVRIGGVNAEVLYAGAAPTYVSGLMQINVRVPSTVTIPSGQTVVNAPVELNIGGNINQQAATIVVR